MLIRSVSPDWLSMVANSRIVIVREYVSGAKNSSALLDLLAAESTEGEPDVEVKAGKRKVLYEEVSRYSQMP